MKIRHASKLKRCADTSTRPSCWDCFRPRIAPTFAHITIERWRGRRRNVGRSRSSTLSFQARCLKRRRGSELLVSFRPRLSTGGTRSQDGTPFATLICATDLDARLEYIDEVTSIAQTLHGTHITQGAAIISSFMWKGWTTNSDGRNGCQASWGGALDATASMYDPSLGCAEAEGPYPQGRLVTCFTRQIVHHTARSRRLHHHVSRTKRLGGHASDHVDVGRIAVTTELHPAGGHLAWGYNAWKVSWEAGIRLTLIDVPLNPPPTRSHPATPATAGSERHCEGLVCRRQHPHRLHMELFHMGMDSLTGASHSSTDGRRGPRRPQSMLLPHSSSTGELEKKG